MNCKAYSSFEGVSFDQQIVPPKIRLSLYRNAAQTTTTAHYSWSLLNNKDISNKYTIALRNKFDTLQEISEKPIPNEEYENFVNTYREAAAECIATKLRAKHRVPRVTLAVKKKRDDMKIASQCNRRNPTNVNAQKVKKAQSKLNNTYLKKQKE